MRHYRLDILHVHYLRAVRPAIIAEILVQAEKNLSESLTWSRGDFQLRGEDQKNKELQAGFLLLRSPIEKPCGLGVLFM